MKRIMILLPFLLVVFMCGAQYNKVKIQKLLSGDNEKSWTVSGINIDRPEKKFIFNKNYSVKVESTNGIIKNEKWSLKSTDEIRWFLSIGNQTYEFIISYDKKGNEYIKLTHQAVDNKTSGYYEIKLNPIK